MRTMQIAWHCVCGDPESSHRSGVSGEECWGHCQKTERDCSGNGYRPIDHSVRTYAFRAILGAALDAGWPTHYTMDLSTDYQMTSDYAGSFIWVLREMGTHLYPLQPETQLGQEWQTGYVMAALRYHSRNTTGLVFYWNASKCSLEQVSWDTALAIASAYPAAA